MLPSVKTIERKLRVDRATALKVRKVLDGRLVPREASVKCDQWVRDCYNEPALHEQMLCAVDDILGNHGVESVDDPYGNIVDDGVRMCPEFSYSNTGDTYATTVVRDHRHSRWLIAAWGDLVEERGL